MASAPNIPVRIEIVGPVRDHLIEAVALLRRLKDSDAVTHLHPHVDELEAGRNRLADAVILAHRQLAEDGFRAPSPALLRARLMLDHAREARDRGRTWPAAMYLRTCDLEALDAAEASAAAAYIAAVNVERAGGDLLAGSASPAEITVMLRRSQAERDSLVAENLKLETRLAIAEIAINSAQQENRAPVWPPVPEPAVDPDPADRMIAPVLAA